jgi:hypothetical protein
MRRSGPCALNRYLDKFALCDRSRSTMGADAEDIGLTIHPHPTLSETIAMAAEMFEGSITDLIAAKRR